MYGDKREKRARLEKLAGLLAVSAQGVRQAALAKTLGVARSTVRRDLADLEALGVLLAEDRDGRITMAGLGGTDQ